MSCSNASAQTSPLRPPPPLIQLSCSNAFAQTSPLRPAPPTMMTHPEAQRSNISLQTPEAQQSPDLNRMPVMRPAATSPPQQLIIEPPCQPLHRSPILIVENEQNEPVYVTPTRPYCGPVRRIVAMETIIDTIASRIVERRAGRIRTLPRRYTQ